MSQNKHANNSGPAPVGLYSSRFDPSRDTVGKIYRDAQIGYDGSRIEIGEMKGAILPDLVNDINEALCIPCEKPFYLLMTEKRDLQMKNAFARTFKHLSYRPYPEDSTTVFWKDPKSQELRFCWDLPHWSEMDNILNNPLFYDIELVNHIIAWKKNDLSPFGFYYHKEHKWIPNPKHVDRRVDQNSKSG
jgi:hypothetical protein